MAETQNQFFTDTPVPSEEAFAWAESKTHQERRVFIPSGFLIVLLVTGILALIHTTFGY